MPVERFPILPVSSTSRPHVAGPVFPVRHLPAIHKRELNPAWPQHQQPSALFAHRIFLLRSTVAASRRDALLPWSRLGTDLLPDRPLLALLRSSTASRPDPPVEVYSETLHGVGESLG